MRTPILTKACLRAALFACCVAALAAPSVAERLPIKIFTSADGLGSSFVSSLMRDSRGFLWVCTRDGLSRFDGSRFVTYQIGDNGAPPGIEQILETRKGVYWISTTGGLFRFDPPKCGDVKLPNNLGHKNTLGLTNLGEEAINLMMSRGMLIDIDHMSQLSANKTLAKAAAVPGGYPLVSGHNNVRTFASNQEPNENNRTIDQLKKIADLGGMFGLGSDAVTAADYLNNYLTASQSMVVASKGLVPRHPFVGQVAFGTDLNGLVRGPQPGANIDSYSAQNLSSFTQRLKACEDRVYNSSFVLSETGDKKWDYCRDGVAHYGMLADFLKDMYGMKGGDDLRANIMLNAEVFARMWEKAVKNSANVQR